jgi:hypothetical protein
MRRSIFHRSLLAGLLILSFTCPGDAEESSRPVSHGIVLTIVARDPKTHTATVRADEGGQAFQIPNSAFWTIGAKLLCDVVQEGARGPQLQHCQRW